MRYWTLSLFWKKQLGKGIDCHSDRQGISGCGTSSDSEEVIACR